MYAGPKMCPPTVGGDKTYEGSVHLIPPHGERKRTDEVMISALRRAVGDVLCRGVRVHVCVNNGERLLSLLTHLYSDHNLIF